LLTIYFI